MRDTLIDKSPAELTDIVVRMGLPRFTTGQLAQWLHVKKVLDIDDMTNLSKAARKKLAESYETGIREPLRTQTSVDGTEKFLFPTGNGQQVETVFIPDEERGTVCLSTQVGCPMACTFCQTGRQGFHGNLSVADILAQLYWVAASRRVTNVVVMGQGEPLRNTDNVLKALNILCHPQFAAWSPHRITLSTVGIRGELQRFLDGCQCHLAVSLHSPIPAQRYQLMPAEGGWSIREVLQVLRQYDFRHQRHLSFEYLLLKGVNDTPLHAKETVKLLRGLNCKVNLLRFHDIGQTQWQGAQEDVIIAFRDYLTKHGIHATIRRSRGQDIDAACGMLTTKDSSRP